MSPARPANTGMRQQCPAAITATIARALISDAVTRDCTWVRSPVCRSAMQLLGDLSSDDLGPDGVELSGDFVEI